ncbi:AAA family ATPase [Yinghuangia seranimata]|uniref:AAA family ATPase n=1 Tax=Yinghuangia seranimata TaxID=408067 RepID=UPI00248C7F13|nr:AAA family ATPase [Yinghuangia seranimata]MDI2132300.1 AAA family ATPase [Yinghuangia seranimata]
MTIPPIGRVLVLTGPPGAGKSTVAGLLAQELRPSVHLRGDDFWHVIKRGSIPPYLPEANRQNEVVTQVFAEAATGYASGGYQVVADGVVGPWFIDRFRDAARARGVQLHYVVLRPDEATTLARATARDPDALTDPEPVLDLHRRLRDLGTYEPHALDSTHWDAETTADAILNGLVSGAYLM